MTTHLILVDENDNQRGTTDVLDAHRGTAKRHRAISVFLFNKKGELLMQQRSAKKIVGAFQWANTCCGNVHDGETREACARRRLKEELGITDVVLRPLCTFEYHVQCNPEFSEWEIDQVFVGEYDGEVQPNPDEVKTYAFMKIADIEQEIKAQKEIYAPWFHIFLKNKNVHDEIQRRAYAR
ncbi:MAG: isopentenyl-diphosphate delta-isomerase [Candidatus Pacebacteria bacterium RIFCSPHIGHO2_01_FULL_46_10]|nr:MAG: isopentenyl-diphosphate delta-isomerase [Candidatus Pacebacteria bacterium RIFCSPHIGHO2_01_FULL_46_10]